MEDARHGAARSLAGGLRLAAGRLLFPGCSALVRTPVAPQRRSRAVAVRFRAEAVAVAVEGRLPAAEQLTQRPAQRLARPVAQVELAGQLLEREPVPMRVTQDSGHRVDLDFHE